VGSPKIGETVVRSGGRLDMGSKDPSNDTCRLHESSCSYHDRTRHATVQLASVRFIWRLNISYEKVHAIAPRYSMYTLYGAHGAIYDQHLALLYHTSHRTQGRRVVFRPSLVTFPTSSQHARPVQRVLCTIRFCLGFMTQKTAWRYDPSDEAVTRRG